jgi:Fuc2NAc and GlcNAc transferase
MTNLNATAVVLFFAIALGASWIGVALFRRWVLRRNLLDIPNERSSHSTPTPRGGGFVIALLGLVGYLAVVFFFSAPFSWGFFFGALLIATVSWLDDLYSLPFWTRLIVHIAAASVLVADLGVWHEISIPLVAGNAQLGTILGGFVTIGWVVWLVNAYNFMDGIDGIAALQAAIAGVAWAVVAITFGFSGLFLVGGLIASVSIGFLFHNWQPAGIFMGDVGSAFLGFTLAAFPLLARNEAKAEMPVLPIVAVLFVWFFVFDTVFTFLKRAVNKSRVWEAHREHIYQKMVIGGMTHATVTLVYGLAATILSVSICLALIFAGISTLFVVFSLLVLTVLIIYLGAIKKR